METTRFGRTGLSVSRTAFGCLPIQRIPAQDAAALLRRAVEGGINFFDTARAYTDSEEKMGLALPACAMPLFWPPRRPRRTPPGSGRIWKPA